MFNKLLILIGRTFVATFVLVNLFNIIPVNYSSNAWFVQVSMLLVDTCSLLLLGLSSLKLASFLSMKKEAELGNKNISKEQNQKYQKNIKVIDKFSGSFMYLFIFIAILQIFVVVNGLSQLDMLYTERVLRIEKQNQVNQEKIVSKSKINLESNKNNDNSTLSKFTQKDKILEKITKQRNSSKTYLIINAIKVFLMSLIWAYGFFKLAKFT